jgi:hypothetical protein
MFTSHRILLPVAIATLLIGCRADVDAPCAMDSDCDSGLWCSPHTLTCVEVDCADGLCTAPEESLFPTDTGPGNHRRGTDGPKVMPLCDPSTGTAWAVTSFLVGTAGEPGQGLDVDQNPNTCDGIDGECSDGIDNSFARLSSLVNTFMTSGVANGDIRLALHIAESVPSESTEPACAALSILRLLDESSVASLSFLPGSGAPASSIGNVESTESQLLAGPDGVFIMPLAVLGAVLSVKLTHVSLEANRSIAAEDSGILKETLEVTIGGALTREALESAILSMPDSAVDRAGLSRQDILGIINPLLEEDLSLDDSDVDMISIGLTMNAVRSNPWNTDEGQFGLSTGLVYALCTPDDEGLPCDDGNPCTLGDVCLEGECTSGLINVCECNTDADCAEGDDLCDGVDRCALDYTCQSDPTTAPPPCDGTDDTDCAINDCDPATGTCLIQAISDDMLCEDSDPCWTVKVCEAGECKGVAWNASTCEEPACVDLVAEMCDDGVPCTVDFCTSALGCSTVDDHSKCDDEDPCTADACDPVAGDASGCVHDPLPPQACSN